MKLDTKQKVLVAIYTEYQKDIPDMERAISSKIIGIDNNAFKMALLKLQNEQLITGADFVKDGNSNIPAVAWPSNIMMTNYGIKYVEEKLDIKPVMTAEEKLKKVVDKTTKWGFEQLKDIAAKTLAEIIK